MSAVCSPIDRWIERRLARRRTRRPSRRLTASRAEDEREHDEPFLQRPADEHLGRRPAHLGCDRSDRGVVQPTALGQRAVGLDHDSAPARRERRGSITHRGIEIRRACALVVLLNPRRDVPFATQRSVVSSSDIRAATRLRRHPRPPDRPLPLGSDHGSDGRGIPKDRLVPTAGQFPG